MRLLRSGLGSRFRLRICYWFRLWLGGRFCLWLSGWLGGRFRLWLCYWLRLWLGGRQLWNFLRFSCVAVFTGVGFDADLTYRWLGGDFSFIPVMIYGTDFPRFFRLAHGADPLLASIFRAGRRGHGLPFTKAVAGGRNLCRIFYCITVLAVDGLASCFGAGRRLINRKIRIPAVGRAGISVASFTASQFRQWMDWLPVSVQVAA